MFKRNYRILSLTILTALILACAPVLAATPAPQPVFDPGAISTIVALTAQAAATETALIVPSATNTLPPTFTPQPTDTPSATFIFILSTPTVPSSTPTIKPTSAYTSTLSATGSANATGTSAVNSKYMCKYISQTPADGIVMKPKTDFDANWLVQNTGTATWDPATSGYTYVGGDALQKTVDTYNFGAAVAPKDEVHVIVDMLAPKAVGTYSATWKLFVGKNSFCVLTMTIVVR
jgi:hypothetical protein